MSGNWDQSQYGGYPQQYGGYGYGYGNQPQGYAQNFQEGMQTAYTTQQMGYGQQGQQAQGQQGQPGQQGQGGYPQQYGGYQQPGYGQQQQYGGYQQQAQAQQPQQGYQQSYNTGQDKGKGGSQSQGGGNKQDSKGSGKGGKADPKNKAKKDGNMTLEEYNAQKAAKLEAQKAKAAEAAIKAKAAVQAEREKKAAEGEAEKKAAEDSAAAEAAAAEKAAADAAAAEKASAEKAAADKAAAEKAAADKAAADAAASADDWEEVAEAKPEAEAEKTPAEEPTPEASVEAAEASPEASGEEEEEEAVATKKDSKGLMSPDARSHLNVVFIGHVDAGKSTTCGNILLLAGYIDQRTIDKYKREAVDKNRESWFLAYIMDTNEEEKAKGKTVEVGRAHFETPNRRFTVLDAPGHKSYVPNMISGASQADVAVLIISARKGEFETGFEKGGQTREHAVLAKTLGVSKLIVAVNKMDDPSVEWSKERYDEIVTKTTPFFKLNGYDVKSTDSVEFIPISGLTGQNLKEQNIPKGGSWYSGPCLWEVLDSLKMPERDPELPFRIPLLDGYKDMGMVIGIGKVEQGTVKPGDKAIIMPTKVETQVLSVYIEDDEVAFAKPGENIRLRLKNVDEDQVSKGFVLSPLKAPCHACTRMKVQLMVLELLEQRPILTPGYNCILHLHTSVEECQIVKLYEATDKKTKKTEKKPKWAKEGNVCIAGIEVVQQVAVAPFTETQQIGRFTLRDEGKTIAIGKILEVSNK